MNIKTRELTGAALDWAMAKAQGWVDYPNDSIESHHWFMDAKRAPFGPVMGKKYWTPSTDWDQGGLIIEREGILFHGSTGAYTAWIPNVAGAIAVGETHLIAAMRCYVAAKLGEEVDVPSELL